jgi:hypothetical protein
VALLHYDPEDTFPGARCTPADAACVFFTPADAACVFCGAPPMYVGVGLGTSQYHRCTRCTECYWLGNERAESREQLFKRVWEYGRGLYGLWAHAANAEVRKVARLRLLAHARRNQLSFDRITKATELTDVLDALAPKWLREVPGAPSTGAPSVFGPMVAGGQGDEYAEMLKRYGDNLANDLLHGDWVAEHDGIEPPTIDET